MKLYGAAQAGGSLTGLSPGDRMVLFDGTETPAAGVTSVAFCRAPGGPMQVPAPMVFTINYAGAVTGTVLVQGSNIDSEADYQTLSTSVNLQNDFYQDGGNFTFYRVKLSAYTSGGMPIVVVQR